MTIKDRIISYLKHHPEGTDDDNLARTLGLKTRQHANHYCRELAQEGQVTRKLVNGKIHNFWIGREPSTNSSVASKTQSIQNVLPKTQNWFWEGNIQKKAINYLTGIGYHIHSSADTASHQQGIDIVAEKDGKQIWVTVKGYPEGTRKTNPSTQAGHWFKQAIFDIIEYRERNKDVLLAVAIPDYPRYRSLTQKITWIKPVAKFSYFWVKADGAVETE